MNDGIWRNVGEPMGLAICSSCNKQVFVPAGTAVEGLCYECYRKPLDEIDRQILADIKDPEPGAST